MVSKATIRSSRPERRTNSRYSQQLAVPKLIRPKRRPSRQAVCSAASVIEDIDIVFTIGTDPADFLERPALGKFRAIGNNPVSVVSVSDDHRNIPPRDC